MNTRKRVFQVSSVGFSRLNAERSHSYFTCPNNGDLRCSEFATHLRCTYMLISRTGKGNDIHIIVLLLKSWIVQNFINKIPEMPAIWSALPLLISCLVCILCDAIQSQPQCPAVQSVVESFCKHINSENRTIVYEYLTCDQQCWVVSKENVQVNVSCHKNHQLQLKHGVEACE